MGRWNGTVTVDDILAYLILGFLLGISYDVYQTKKIVKNLRPQYEVDVRIGNSVTTFAVNDETANGEKIVGHAGFEFVARKK